MTESTDFQNWLDLAQKEFAYACSDLEHPEENFFALTCFHFQQSAEKALKSFILKNDTALLNPFYTETRYPVHWPINITQDDAEKAKGAADNILKFVKEKLKLE